MGAAAIAAVAAAAATALAIAALGSKDEVGTYEVAAVAWTHILGCKTMNDRVFDAFRAFGERFVDKGPELIP